MAEAGPGAPPRRSPVLLPLDLARGFGIGTAELVPGVSGGTVALVTGVYDELIDSAGHVLGGVRQLLTGPDRWRSFVAELRRTDWWLVLPVLVGMAAAVLTIAGVMEAFVTGHPELARGLFFGLVAMSIVVPLRMVTGEGRPLGRTDLALLAGVAVTVGGLMLLLGGGRTIADPPLVLVFAAAAVAVCALVVPGVSGSFFLLAVGLYSTTLGAVHDRDLLYLGVFAAGMVTGLATFVPLLRHLLHQVRRPTLLTMAGLMAGSLVALWPWQGEATGAAAEAHGPGLPTLPTDPLLGPIALAVAGAAVVGVLVLIEERTGR